jgi:hypothetical protein
VPPDRATIALTTSTSFDNVGVGGATGSSIVGTRATTSTVAATLLARTTLAGSTS